MIELNLQRPEQSSDNFFEIFVDTLIHLVEGAGDELGEAHVIVL